MDVSIVIPLYNAEQYLRECVESILRSAVCQIEVIIVDDASTDRSLDIAQRIAGDDPRVRVIAQPRNGGVSRARNVGIKAARGQFVMFVDPDDMLETHALDQMLAHANLTGADLVLADMAVFFDGEEGRRFTKYWRIEHEGVFRYYCAGTLADLPKIVYSVSCCAKLYRRHMLLEKRILFPDGVDYAEDHPFVLDALVAASLIVVYPAVAYLYRKGNAVSATGRAFPVRRFGRIREMIKDNTAKLSGWPLFYYSRRVIDYEILQNVHRIRDMNIRDGRTAFLDLVGALACCDRDVADVFVDENPQYRRDYYDLVNRSYLRCRLRYSVTHSTSEVLSTLAHAAGF